MLSRISTFFRPQSINSLLPKNNCSLLEMIDFLEHTSGVRCNDEIAEIVDRIISYFRASKTNINSVIREGCTVLMAFSHTNEKDIDTETVEICMKKFIAAGADLELKNEYGCTALSKVIFHYSLSQLVNVIDGEGNYISPRIHKKIGRKPLTFMESKHLFSQARLLLNAGAILEDLPFLINHAPLIDLFNGGDLAKYNMLFLFLKGMSSFLKYNNAFTEQSYQVIYHRLSYLISELSEEKLSEKTGDGSVKSLPILYKKSRHLLKKLPYPELLTKAFEPIQSINEIDLLRSTLVDYIGTTIQPTICRFFNYLPTAKQVAEEKLKHTTIQSNILRYS